MSPKRKRGLRIAILACASGSLANAPPGFPFRPGSAGTYNRPVRPRVPAAAPLALLAAGCAAVAGGAGCRATENAAAVRGDLIRTQDALAEANARVRNLTADLTAAEGETLALRARLADAGAVVAEAPEQARALGRVAGVSVSKLLTGPLDRDGAPGDELLAVTLAPVDADGAPVKAAGSVEIDLTDLAADGPDRTVGSWAFDAAGAADRWRSTALGSGYRFRLPLAVTGAAAGGAKRELQLHVRFETADGRRFDAARPVAVTLTPRPVAVTPRPSTDDLPPAPAVAGDPFEGL